MPREAPDTRAIREARERVMIAGTYGTMWQGNQTSKRVGRESSTSEFDMTVYVAMLRGVNVGGNSLKMDWLRASCENLGCRNVQTYVQSGNIVFSSRASAGKLAQTLKATIDAQTRLPVTVILRNATEMERIVAGNPFLRKDIDVAKLHVTFLGNAAVKPALDRLDALAGARDQYRFAGSEIYLNCPINYGET